MARFYKIRITVTQSLEIFINTRNKCLWSLGNVLGSLLLPSSPFPEILSWFCSRDKNLSKNLHAFFILDTRPTGFLVPPLMGRPLHSAYKSKEQEVLNDFKRKLPGSVSDLGFFPFYQRISQPAHPLTWGDPGISWQQLLSMLRNLHKWFISGTKNLDFEFRLSL